MEIKLKKGLDLQLAGAVADLEAALQCPAAECAVCPADFPGFVPKIAVREGDKVTVGQPLLFDKNHPQVKAVSPLCGTVKAVVRGDRRRIERVVVTADGNDSTLHDTSAVDSRDKALMLLAESGMLVRMRQRPYDIVPNPEVAPRDIFVTAIDKAPLSPGLIPAMKADAKDLAAAAKLLGLLTDGKVYLCVGDDWTLGNIPGTETVRVHGPHPAGNPGVQIANIAPVNKGETVWTLDIVTMAKIGRLLATGHYEPTAVVALTGSEVQLPHLAETVEGAAIQPLVADQLTPTDRHIRIISGNVLTGIKVDTDSYLHFPYRQITVIPEGDDVTEFMGWASLSPKKMSVSRSFPGHFLSSLFRPDARILGGRRAMIMSGEYDKVVPMDILTEYLLKAIIGKDIEAMESLGIYEVAPEDFALAEYVDTSKLPVQQLVREGLDYLRKELE